LAAWQASGLATASLTVLDPQGLAERLRAGSVTLLDVRDEDEWQAGHVEGSLLVPYRELRKGVPRDLPQEGSPIAVACSAGNRSALAASLLRRLGVENVIHVADGGINDLA